MKDSTKKLLHKIRYIGKYDCKSCKYFSDGAPNSVYTCSKKYHLLNADYDGSCQESQVGIKRVPKEFYIKFYKKNGDIKQYARDGKVKLQKEPSGEEILQNCVVYCEDYDPVRYIL